MISHHPATRHFWSRLPPDEIIIGTSRSFFNSVIRSKLQLTALTLGLLAAGFSTAGMAQLSTLHGAAKPPLMLANVYSPNISLADYWVSEKYDGVRGFWDGQKLHTRGGQIINAPAWFTANWPTTPMDGELWAGRGQFQKAVSTVRQQTPDDAAWQGIRFMVFDLPAEKGTFTERLSTLGNVVSKLAVRWVQAAPQTKVASHAALQSQLKQITKAGAEGLMLHRGSSLYKGVRSDDLLKVKTHDDAEAKVIAHLTGKGKYARQVGALLVEMPAKDGQPARRFKLGTGLSDAQRQNPPVVGSLVTYRYRGLNDSGIPRFASFMRVREE